MVGKGIGSLSSNKQLDNLWNGLVCLCLLYDITCFLLVIVEIYVPASRTHCRFAV